MTGVFKVRKNSMPSKGCGEKVLLLQIIHTSDIQALEWIKVLSDSSNH